MDDVLSKLKTPESCEQYATNVESRHPDLALAARRQAVALRAARHGATSDVEQAAWRAVYAYERARSLEAGKTIRASRTRSMIERLGALAAVERIVTRRQESMGYQTLAAMGMLDMAFEAVVIDHPDAFSAEALVRSRQRLPDYVGGGGASRWRPRRPRRQSLRSSGNCD